MIAGLYLCLLEIPNRLTSRIIVLSAPVISVTEILKPALEGSTMAVSPVTFLFFRACHATFAEPKALDNLFLDGLHDL